MWTYHQQPSVRSSTRTCSQRKTVKTILAGDTSYLRKKHDMRNNRTGPQSALPPTPLRFRESIENIKMWTARLTDQPVSNLFSFLSMPQSFIIHSSYLLTITMIGRPTPFYPKALPTRFAVRLQEEGREESGHAFYRH